MIREEREFILNIANKIGKLLDKEFEKYGYDRAYFEFIIKVNILNENFRKIDEIVLLNEENSSGGWCEFCREKSYYYDNEMQIFLCPKCLKEIKNV